MKCPKCGNTYVLPETRKHLEDFEKFLCRLCGCIFDRNGNVLEEDVLAKYRKGVS
jgi:transposase-like protein